MFFAILGGEQTAENFCIPWVLAYGIGGVFLILFAAIGKLWLSNQKKEDQLHTCLDARIAHGQSIKGPLAEALKELLGEEKDGDGEGEN